MATSKSMNKLAVSYGKVGSSFQYCPSFMVWYGMAVFFMIVDCMNRLYIFPFKALLYHHHCHHRYSQGGFDGRGQPTASPMLTAIMSGGVGISGRELYKYR